MVEPITLLMILAAYKFGQRKGGQTASEAKVAPIESPVVSAPRRFPKDVRAKLVEATGVEPNGAIAWAWRANAANALKARLGRCSLQAIESPEGVQFYLIAPLRTVSAWETLSSSIEKRYAISCALTCILSRGDGIVAVSHSDVMPDMVRLSEHFAAYPLPPIETAKAYDASLDVRAPMNGAAKQVAP